MSSVTGIFAIVETKQSALLSGEFYEVGQQINNALREYFDENTRFYLSLDQSTTCTGICIRDVEGTVYSILDFKRENTDKYLYISQLRKLVSSIVSGLRLNLIVIESPLNLRFSKATPVLRELKGFIESWRYDIPEFFNIPMESILPQQWKAKVLDKSKGTNRYQIKKEIAIDICDKLPILKRYFVRCPATDYDSFDATGIILGYLAQNYDTAGNKVNYGSAIYNYKMHIFVKYIPVHDVKNLDVVMKGLPRKQDPILLKYNQEHTFFDNIRMLCGSYDIGYFIIENTNIMLDMFWETNENSIKGNCFICVVARQGYFTQKQLEKAKDENHYFYLE